MCGHLSELIFEQKLNFNCQRKVNEKSESKVKEIKRNLCFALPVFYLMFAFFCVRFFNRFVDGSGRPLIRTRIRFDSLTSIISFHLIRFEFIHFHSKSSSPISSTRPFSCLYVRSSVSLSVRMSVHQSLSRLSYRDRRKNHTKRYLRVFNTNTLSIKKALTATNFEHIVVSFCFASFSFEIL